MVESIWFVIVLILLAAVSVALVLTIVLRAEVHSSGRETRTQYLTPNYSDVAGFRLTAYPNNELVILQRLWLIEENIAALDYSIVPGRYMTLFISKRGKCVSRTVSTPTHSRAWNSTTCGYHRHPKPESGPSGRCVLDAR